VVETEANHPCIIFELAILLSAGYKSKFAASNERWIILSSLSLIHLPNHQFPVTWTQSITMQLHTYAFRLSGERQENEFNSGILKAVIIPSIAAYMPKPHIDNDAKK